MYKPRPIRFKSYPRVSQILLSCTSPGVRPYISADCCFRVVLNNNQYYHSLTQYLELMDSNIPTTTTYGVYISQLVIYVWAWSLYSDFLQRHHILSTKLLNRGFLKHCLILSFKKFFVVFIYNIFRRCHNILWHRIVQNCDTTKLSKSYQCFIEICLRLLWLGHVLY